MIITLKNGETKEYEQSLSCKEIIQSLGGNLLRSALCAKVNEKIVDLSYTVNEDCLFEIVTVKDKEGLNVYRHTAAHILAHSIKSIYPTCKLAANGITDYGFYCDVDFNTPITQEDLEKIEIEMRKIIRSNFFINRFTLPRTEAIKLMTKYSERYKVRYIKDLPDDVEISFYKHGSFTDLCRGPHLPSTGKIKAFRLSSISGAYWRGNDRNKMLTRIYGVAFAKKDEVETHFRNIEEGKQYDHRKLGKELNLFSMMGEKKGAPYFMPKGARLKNALIEYWRGLQFQAGYMEVSTPPIISKSQLENSGLWSLYKGEIFTAKINGENCAVKPIGGLGSMFVYKQMPRSYKDFPIKTCELDVVYRRLKSGRLHGLMRTRGFTQDDCCEFLLPSQLSEELSKCIKLCIAVYEQFGLDFEIRVSTVEDAVIDDGKTISEIYCDVLKALDLPFVIKNTDDFFNAPNISFFIRDAKGRKWRCGSVLLDNKTNERYGLCYTTDDNRSSAPLILHNTLFGSVERFLGILIERFAGCFPVWLSPVQVKILTVTDASVDYAKAIGQKLLSRGIRIEQDFTNDRIGKKIRNSVLEHVPYMLIIGSREQENEYLTVRKREKGTILNMTIDEFVTLIIKDVSERIIF